MRQSESQNSRKTITGHIEKIIYLDAKNGKSILSVLKEDGKTCRVLGNINGIGKDCTISATGVWRKDDKYGWQFLAESIAEISQMDGEQEPVEDGLIHALDFSNVLNKRLKEFRKIELNDEDDVTSDMEAQSALICIDGAVYNHDVTKLISVPKDVSSFQIPSSITAIDDRAFNGCIKLSSIVIPDSVTSIGAFLFDHCAELSSIRFSSSIIDIDGYVFCDCPKLTSVEIPGVETSVEYDDILKCKYICIRSDSFQEIDGDWKNVRIGNGYFSISYMSGNNSLIIKNDYAKPFMNNILKRVSNSLPSLKIRLEEGSKSKLENQQILDDVISILLENIIVKTIKIDWHEVKFLDHGIQLTDPLGNIADVRYEKAMGFMNKMLKRMADYLPRLIVHFEEGKDPVIENIAVLDDITTILTQRQDYGASISSNIKSSDVLKALRLISKKDTRVFVPRDKSPYLDFLSENQAIDKYPIVPIEEYIGGGYEDGALFTIIMNGMPHIVWENFNDSRSTYIFKCTEDGYEDMRQRIFDYIVTQESNKRQFLRTDKCEEIFGEKPRLLVHNTLESWVQRLMSVPKLDMELEGEA